MIKHFCDRCGVESKDNHSLNPVSILCHLAEVDKRDKVNGYSDSDGNAISGRSVTFELCNRCYNKVMKPVADSILGGPDKEPLKKG
jgi:hypothetical protein